MLIGAIEGIVQNAGSSTSASKWWRGKARQAARIGVQPNSYRRSPKAVSRRRKRVPKNASS
jgi:hypothetical protein